MVKKIMKKPVLLVQAPNILKPKKVKSKFKDGVRMKMGDKKQLRKKRIK